MRNFKTWLVESADTADKPHHIYHTKDGHEVHVHLEKHEHGTTAHFHNHSLGGMEVKSVSWRPGAKEPSKHELEQLSFDDEDEDNNLHEDRILNFTEIYEAAGAKKPKAEKPAKEPKPKKEAAHVLPSGKLSTNAGGVITELATHYHLNEHIHKMAGTSGSPEHEKSKKDIHDQIHEMIKNSKNPDVTQKEVQLRIWHGRQAAADVVRTVRAVHGPKARIVRSAQVSKAGDIPRFTRGHHNDGQENTADVAVEVAGSNQKEGANSDGNHFMGHSLKSSLKKAEITAKNTGASFDGDFDHPSRELKSDEIGRKGLEKHVHQALGISHMNRADRGRWLDVERAKHKEAGGADGQSEVERTANAGSKKAQIAAQKEFHAHITHLASLPNGEGHKVIGNAIVKHLYPDTDMPNYKTKVFGEKEDNIRSVTEPNSTHPIKKVLRDKKTTFRSVLNDGGTTAHIEAQHPDYNNGKPFKVWNNTFKTKSNAAKENTLSTNIKAAAIK